MSFKLLFSKSVFVWSARIILLVGCLACLIIQLIDIYFTYKYHRFSSRLSYQNREYITLPYIRVCSPTWPNETAIQENAISKELFNYMLFIFADGFFNYAFNYTESELRYLRLEYNSLMERLDYRVNDLFQNISRSCNNVLKRCSFGGVRIDCCEHSIVQLYQRGPCYILNYANKISRPYKQGNPGPAGGLEFHFIDDHTSLSVYDQSRMPTFHGITMNTEEETYAINHFESDPVAIDPGASALVQLDLTKTMLISDCKKYKIQTYPDYNIAETGEDGCRKKTFLDEVQRQCNCSPVNFYFYVWNSSFCKPDDFSFCANTMITSNFHGKIDKRHCKKDCTKFEFTQRLSSARFNQKTFKKFNAHEFVNELNSVTKVQVYMAVQGYMSIQEVQIHTWQIIVGNIGGQFGLWLGFSIFGGAIYLINLFKHFICIIPSRKLPVKKIAGMV